MAPESSSPNKFGEATPGMVHQRVSHKVESLCSRPQLPVPDEFNFVRKFLIGKTVYNPKCESMLSAEPAGGDIDILGLRLQDATVSIFCPSDGRAEESGADPQTAPGGLNSHIPQNRDVGAFFELVNARCIIGDDTAADPDVFHEGRNNTPIGKVPAFCPSRGAFAFDPVIILYVGRSDFPLGQRKAAQPAVKNVHIEYCPDLEGDRDATVLRQNVC